MEKTKKLYEVNPYLKEFNATILREFEENNQFIIVLDQTAFYPTGGGQPHDTGIIEDVPVTDVYKKEGIIYHVLESSLKGQTNVTGRINWDRRFDHMQQHAGQHILSRVFEDLYQAETIGFHLGDKIVTIDLNIDTITNEMIEKVETIANQIMMENRVIEKVLQDVSELSEDAVKKIPELDDYVRFVNIRDFDSCLCAGTHPDYTGEIGLIKTVGYENIRKNIRLSFVCGFRALSSFNQLQNELTNTSNLLKTNWFDVTNKTNYLLQERKQLEGEIRSLKAALLPLKVEEWKKKAEVIGSIQYIEAIIEDGNLQEYRQIAQEITQNSSYIVVFASINVEKIQLLLQCSNDVSVAMNEALKLGLEVLNGKGGGNAKMAQGGSIQLEHLDKSLAVIRNYISHFLN